ncbi:UNVERIFIED_ORG: hypothetical protein GGE63_004053 [Rhizobium esperanzae]
MIFGPVLIKLDLFHGPFTRLAAIAASFDHDDHAIPQRCLVSDVLVGNADDAIAWQDRARAQIVHRIAGDVEGHQPSAWEAIIRRQGQKLSFRLVHVVNFAECARFDLSDNGDRQKSAFNGGCLDVAEFQTVTKPESRFADCGGEFLHFLAAGLLNLAVQIFVYIRIRNTRAPCKFRTAPSKLDPTGVQSLPPSHKAHNKSGIFFWCRFPMA